MKHLLALVMMIALLTPALAKGRCADDRETFCKGVQKGEVNACLKQHMDKLSEACKAKLEEVQQAPPEPKTE